MACSLPISGRGLLFAQVPCHRLGPSCWQQSFSCAFLLRRKFCFDRRDWTTVRGEYDTGDVTPSNISRSPRPKTNLAAGLASTFTSTEVGVENDPRPPPKPQLEYIVREAKIDEELWAAAWIRAESYSEEQPYVRYIESYKKKFAEQEFDALKRRLRGKYGQSIRCICFVAVSAQSSQNCTINNAGIATILERVVGTLDLSVRQLSRGEAFPGDSKRTLISTGEPEVQRSRRYGYIANVCVTKGARRNGIASRLLCKAIKAAKDLDIKDLYVHVDSANKAACSLYGKFNFQSMEAGALQVGLQNIILLQRHL